MGILMSEENQGEELYNLLAELINQKINRTVLDSIRGEYGVLRHLVDVEDKISAGMLTERLHVVPGRMTDILNSLEKKGLIKRYRDEEDKRRVNVRITAAGKKEVQQKRNYISQEYRGLFQILGRENTKELIRLLGIVVGYHSHSD